MTSGEALGRRLARLRQRAGLSQPKLAERSGVSQPIIWRLENGHTKRPSVDSLQALADALGVTLDYLRFGEPEPLPNADQLEPFYQELLAAAITADLTREEMRDVIEYIRWQRAKRGQ